MKRIFILLTALCLWTTAEATPTLDESIALIEKALPEDIDSFVVSIANVHCPAFASKNNVALQDARLPKLAAAIWKKASGVKVNWSDSDKKVPRRTVISLIKLRNWVLTGRAYGNFVIASGCDIQIVQSLIDGLKQSHFSAQEIEAMLGELNQVHVTLNDFAAVLLTEAPKSTIIPALLEMIKQNKPCDILQKAREICEEQSQEPFVPPDKLIEQTNVGSLLLFHASSTAQIVATKALAAYVSRGGSLSLDDKTLEADLQKRIPEFFREKLPETGSEPEPLGLLLLLRDTPQ